MGRIYATRNVLFRLVSTYNKPEPDVPLSQEEFIRQLSEIVELGNPGGSKRV